MNYKTGTVFDVDHFAVHDGPGIRTSVYLKGCPLRCRWCHSPESWGAAPELLFAPSRCTACMRCVSVCPRGLQREENGRHVFADREKCVLCGACSDACPGGALFVSGREMTSREVADEALEDIAFYKNSGGGVTLSGGEVLAQPEFALEILTLLKNAGVHTIVETTGAGKRSELLALRAYTDVFFYDMKLTAPDALRHYTGGDWEMILGNLETLRKETSGIVLRVPLIPGVTDTPENVSGVIEIARKLEIAEVQLLPYNRSAGAKYEWRGIIYPLGELPAGNDPEALAELGGGSVAVTVAE